MVPALSIVSALVLLPQYINEFCLLVLAMGSDCRTATPYSTLMTPRTLWYLVPGINPTS